MTEVPFLRHAKPTGPRFAILLALVTACQDHTRSEPSRGEPEQISVLYVCGNGFDLQNRSPSPVTVQYEVIGTSEQGELLLPPRPDQHTASTTRLITLHRGSLEVSFEGEALSPVSNPAVACSPGLAAELRATRGEWTPAFAWPVVAVHLHLLPDGKVLSWGAVGTPQVWDPETGEFASSPTTTQLFCSGHAFLPDGRLMVTGGHITEHHGLPDANVFDPAARAWTPVSSMSRGRWYPTSTALPDGSLLTLGGRDQQGREVDLPEIWTGGGWRPLAGARQVLPYYPRMFVAPNGLVFYAGELPQTAYLDPAGAGRWIPVAASKYGQRDYGSAVMYRPGKVMIVGGSDPPEGAPTNTAETIDLNGASPSWRYTHPMSRPRRQFNATLLPDGRVLATGGTSAAGFSNPSGAVHEAEVWDPVSGRWSLLAANRVTRVYHSTTLLLQDGRILHAGSGDGAHLPREVNAELFSPPYLFQGPRPSITDAPKAVGYGQQLFLATPDAGRIIRVTLVRLGSVTHGFDQNQRFLELSFQRAVGGLMVTFPARGELAPPGHYLVFALNEAGVPSMGRTVRVG